MEMLAKRRPSQGILCSNPTSESQCEIINAINLFGSEGNLCFNESLTLTFSGFLDEDTFQLAVKRLVQRHDALRTTFSQDGLEFYVHQSLPAQITRLDLSKSSNSDCELKAVEREAVNNEFDIYYGPLVRISIIKMRYCHKVVISVHHIICDGWSFAILLEDLAKIYSGLVSGTHIGLAEPHYYIDFFHTIADKQHQQKQSNDYDYWLKLFPEIPEPLELPFDRPVQAVRSLQSDIIEYQFNRESCSHIRTLAKQQNCSVVIVLLAAYASLMYRLSGQRNIVIALPAAGQAIEGWYRVIGHCVNTLPIPCLVDPEGSFSHFLQTFKETFLEISDHQAVSLGGLLRRLHMKRNTARLPLASLMFNLDQDMEKFNFAQMEALAHPNGRSYENFELFLNVSEKENGFLLQWQYNSALFNPATIKTWARVYHKLLQQMWLQPELPVDSYDICLGQDSERHRSQTAQHQMQAGQSLIQQLMAKSHTCSDRLAIVSGESLLSYRQLDERSNRLANFLANKGVKSGELIGICLHRNIELIPALMAVWKCGCAYVPLDPGFPVERLHYMSEASGLKTIICQSELANLIEPKPELNIYCVDLLAETIDNQSAEYTPGDYDPEALAYVIFTSGSTGKPKGVMISQRAVANFIDSMAEIPGMEPEDKLLSVTTLSFDISVLELILPLWVGGTLVIASTEESKNSADLINLIESHEINIMQATPSTWQMLLNDNWQGDKNLKLLCGGEAFPQQLAKSLCPMVQELWNMYGPTETCIWSTCFKIGTPEDPVLIGTPIKNTQCYILDHKLDPLPDGFSGELCIGGLGVANGYLNQEELTREKFVLVRIGEVSVPVYRTGDKARWNHDGQLEIYGRMDNQVKIRGYRIELGEIESALTGFTGIQECVSVVSGNGVDKKIIAFYTSTDKLVDNYKILRAHLKKLLPDYMLPAGFVALEGFPKTPNGKIDRKALAALKVDSLPKHDIKPVENALEETILAIWQKVLDLKDIGRDENFFELGGHSLLIGQVISSIQIELNVQLNYHDLYQSPTIESLAEKIQQSETTEQEFILRHLDRKVYPLSFAQIRLWYIEKLTGSNILFNLATTILMQGPLNKEALLKSFNDLIIRQQALRTIIVETEGIPEQHVLDSVTYNVEEIDLRKVSNQAEVLSQRSHALRDTEFQLDTSPLFKAVLFILNENEHGLFFVTHHAFFDGWSFDILIHELTNQYCLHAGFPATKLAPLAFHYTDYSAWQQNWILREDTKRKLGYWQQSLQGTLPNLDFLTDYPRPEQESIDGDAIFFELEESLLESLDKIAKHETVSIFMLFLASYSILLHKYTQQDDLVIGVPMADRNRPGTEKLVGFFVNAMVMRFQIDPKAAFGNFLQQVKEQCLSGYENQDAPFEKLVEKLVHDRDTSRAPLYQTSLTYQDVTNRETEMGDVKLGQLEIKQNVSPLDFDMWLKKRGRKLVGGLVYTPALYKKETIVQFKNHFIAFLENISNQLYRNIEGLTFLNKGETRDLFKLGKGRNRAWKDSETIISLFTQSFVSFTNKKAVICGENSLSYFELDKLSNQYANILLQRGIKPGDLVGVCLDRSTELLATLIGIFKAGAAYVPLDPEFPESRLRYMVKDSGISCLITQQCNQDKLPEIDNSICLEDIDNILQKTSDNLPVVEYNQHSPAYVIYTSGSTGKPKGVVVPHKAVVNFLRSMAEQPGLCSEDKLLAVTTLSFDIAALELYLPLTVGGSIVIASGQDSTDIRCLQRLLVEQNITAMQATPSTWRLMINTDWQGDTKLKILCGGEAMPRDLCKILLTKCGELWNMYGPTETTIWSTCHQITDAKQPLSIGEPIANTSLYILDANLQPVPLGVAGELFIGGKGITDGYLNRDKITAAHFVSNPFTGEDRIYRTGDRVRYRRDKSLEYMGRIDSQVKVRGYRIELGEIESVMRQHKEIIDCALAIKEQKTGDVRLVAYVVWRENSLTVTELRRYLRDWLPAYMIPQHIMDMTTLPQTPNGKLDRKNLPDLYTSVSRESTHVEPVSEEEQWLASIWKDLIGVDRVSLYDNFFELGGHSLLSMQVIYKISEKTNITLNPRDLLLDNLEQIAKTFNFSIEGMKEEHTNPAPRRSIKGLFKKILKSD